MDDTRLPIAGDIGIVIGDTTVPAIPVQHEPVFGEYGLNLDDTFIPVIPPFVVPDIDDFAPALSISDTLNRSGAWRAEIGCAVGQICVEPYDWENNRVLILDTVADVDATPEEKALPGYVANPGLTLHSRTYDRIAATLPEPPDYNDTDSIGIRWNYNNVATPQPALRSGQVRYSGLGLGTSAVGTEYDGTPFIPGTAGAFVGGSLRATGYRYGMNISPLTTQTISVKIGRATATWDQASEQLTLACDTTGATIKYSTDGSAPTTTYTGPISISDTTTVRWYATKASMVDSNEWQTVVTYQDEAPPEDFATVYFSSLPAYDNATINRHHQFHTRPSWYCSPDGTGDGLTPAMPASATTIIGVAGLTKGKALGSRYIEVSKNSTYNFSLSKGGYYKPGTETDATIEWSDDGGSTWNTYSAPVTPTLPGQLLLKLTTAHDGGYDITREFIQPWYLGTGASIDADWDATAKTLTLTYSDPDDSIALYYSLDGSAPSIEYIAPITIAATTTPKTMARHRAYTRHDFATESDVQTLTTIDPDVTADYSESKALAFVPSSGAITTHRHTQTADVVWCTEGTYTDMRNSAEPYIRGGFNSDFTKHNPREFVSIFADAGLYDFMLYTTDTLYNSKSVLEGCKIETTVATVIGITYACWSDITTEWDGLGDGTTDPIYIGRMYGCKFDWVSTTLPAHRGRTNSPYQFARFVNLHLYYMYGCAVNINLTCLNGSDGIGGTSGQNSAFAVWLENRAMFDSNIDISITSGNGGDGSMEVYEYDEFGYPVSWSAGNGGTSYAGIAISAGVNRSAERCNIDLNAQSGTAGDGVQGPLYEEYPLGYGANGESLAGIQLYFPATDCFVVCNATSGDGGSAVIDDGMGGRQLFGLSQAGIDLAAALATRTDLEANAQSGEISEDSFIYSTSQFPLNNLYYWQQDAVVKLTRYSSYYSTYGNYTALTLTATTGDQSRLSSVQVEDGFTSISWDTPPTITEGATPDGDGNPSRVDATGSGSNGWYTGEPNGNGAPLDGYETPGSGGITLGRYWE